MMIIKFADINNILYNSVDGCHNYIHKIFYRLYFNNDKVK